MNEPVGWGEEGPLWSTRHEAGAVLGTASQVPLGSTWGLTQQEPWSREASNLVPGHVVLKVVEPGLEPKSGSVALGKAQHVLWFPTFRLPQVP